MLILASDTSTKSLSVAICSDSEIILSNTIQTGMTHSQTHMPAIIKILEDACLHFSDIDLFVCATGPGSYTGIRIGVATTKAMAYAANKGAIGISTLETLAFPHNEKHILVCPMLDARNHRVFSSGYFTREITAEHSYGNIVIQEANRTLDEFLAQIADFIRNSDNACKKLIFCGDGAGIYQNDEKIQEFESDIKREIKSGIKCEIIFNSTIPDAADAAKIAYAKLCENGEEARTDPFLLKANYISPSQAERMKDKGKDKRTVQLTPLQKTRSESDEPTPCRKSDEPFPCVIRFATPQDIPGIYELEKECFTIPWSFESLAKDISENKKATYLVALCNGKIVGYIGMWQIFDDAEITNLAVIKDFRKKGIGNRLIQRICLSAKSKGAGRMMLEVRQTNTDAIDVYMSNNFKMISIRKSYYKDTGEDAIIMLKNL